jgi:hypothetical protein
MMVPLGEKLIYTRMYVYAYKYIRTYMLICLYMCIYVSLYVRVCIRMYVYTLLNNDGSLAVFVLAMMVRLGKNIHI